MVRQTPTGVNVELHADLASSLGTNDKVINYTRQLFQNQVKPVFIIVYLNLVKGLSELLSNLVFNKLTQAAT